MGQRSEKNRIEDPILDVGALLTLLGFFFMYSNANPFNPLLLMISLICFLAGLYLVVLRVNPKEAKYFRESLLDKIDSLFEWLRGKIGK